MLNLNKKKIYKNLLFDADGTLLDFAKVETLAINKTFSKFNIDKSYIPYFKKYNSLLWYGLENNLLKSDFILNNRFDHMLCLLNKQSITKEVTSFYNNCISQGYDLLDDCEFVIKTLKEKGYNISIITNGLSMIQRQRFSKISFTPLLDNIIISDEIGYSKPDTMFFEKALKICNITDKSSVLVIGDRVQSDIIGANNYNLDSVLINTKNNIIDSKEKEPTYIVSSLIDLLTIL